MSLSKDYLASVDTIFFDMDGTLFMSEMVGPEAARMAVAKLYAEEGIDDPLQPKSYYLSQIGKPDMEYFQALLPEKHAPLAKRLRDIVISNELAIIEEVCGAAFPQANETLDALRQRGYRLGIASNCGAAYFDAVCTNCGFAQRVDMRLCIGNRGFCTKADLIEEMMDVLETKAAVLIGDRINDLDAARATQIPFIAANWGYAANGELDEADAAVESFDDFLALFPGTAYHREHREGTENTEGKM